MPTKTRENHPAQPLPKILNYCFSPCYSSGQKQSIVIVVDEMRGHIPTVISCGSVHDAESLCDRFNARLGLSRDGWREFVRRRRARDIQLH